MEAALDRGYYQELLTRAAALPSEDRAVVEPLLRHAAETFRRQLFARGHLHYGLAPEVLAQFDDACAARDSEIPAEAVAANQLHRLANQAMRRNPIGLGTVIGYVTLRQIEIANLITISEGLRLGLPAETIRARMTPRSLAHV
jgi:vacuolar-type H+-ATPase subunit C/Vma6